MLGIFVLIDALGWEYLGQEDFLNDVLKYRAPLQTILGFSSGAIPTILTGAPPSVTGHWNLFYYDPDGSPFRWLRSMQFLPQSILDHRVTRKVMKELGRRVLGMGPLFECSVSPRFLPWFNYVEKKNIYGYRSIAGSQSIFDHLRKQRIPHKIYSYHDLNDAEIIDQSIRDVQSCTARFFFLYLSEMDMFLHMNCDDRSKVEQRLRWYGKALRGLYEAAKSVDPDASMTVISDHGMTPIRHHFDLVSKVEELNLQMPQDYLAVYDSTMARFWFFNESARRSVDDCLRRLSCGRFMSDEELRTLGVFFEDRRYGELIFVLNPGWLLTKSDFNGKGWMPKGMHGYDPQDSWSYGIYLSSHRPPVPVRTVADVYSCMRATAGIADA